MTFAPTPHTVRVRRITEGPPDVLGIPTQVTTEHDWAVYFIAPGAMTEPNEPNRDLSLIEHTIGAPASADVPTEYDEVQHEGEWFKVNGRRKDYDLGPFGFEPGVIVELVRANG